MFFVTKGSINRLLSKQSKKDYEFTTRFISNFLSSFISYRLRMWFYCDRFFINALRLGARSYRGFGDIK